MSNGPGFLPPPPWEGPPFPGASWREKAPDNPGNPLVMTGGQLLDSGLDAMAEAKRLDLEGKGYPPGLVGRALGWARNYTEGMTRLIPEPAVQEALMRSLYPQALKMSETWIRSIQEAMSQS